MTEPVAEDALSANWKLRFGAVFAAQALSLIGSQLATFALVWWLTQHTGSAGVLAAATSLALLPEIALGPFAGALVDRWDRRMVMVVADGAVAGIAALVAWAAWRGALAPAHVYAITLARAVGGVFHWPAMQASVSLLVPTRHLSRVAGLNQTLDGLLGILVPPLGAWLLSQTTVGTLMGIDVITALLAVSLLAAIRIPRPPLSDGIELGHNLLGQLGEAVAFLRSVPGLGLLVLAMAALQCLLTPAYHLLPILVSQRYGGGADLLGWVQSLSGIGAIAGGGLLAWWGGGRRQVATAALGVLILALAVATMGVLPPQALTGLLALQLAAGVAAPLSNGPLFATFQALVAPRLQGRVFMLLGSAVGALAPLGMMAAGWIVDRHGPGVWYVGSAVGCLAIALLLWRLPALSELDNYLQATREEQT